MTLSIFDTGEHQMPEPDNTDIIYPGRFDEQPTQIMRLELATAPISPLPRYETAAHAALPDRVGVVLPDAAFDIQPPLPGDPPSPMPPTPPPVPLPGPPVRASWDVPADAWPVVSRVERLHARESAWPSWRRSLATFVLSVFGAVVGGFAVLGFIWVVTL